MGKYVEHLCKGHYDNLTEALREIGKLQAENKRLKEELEKYGQHLSDCELIRQPFLSAANSMWECDCGLKQALQEKP